MNHLKNPKLKVSRFGIIQTGEYTAQNELRFVKGIGSHVRNKGFYLDRSRLKILRSYRRSLDKREVWGDLDKEVILQFVEEEIKREEVCQLPRPNGRGL